jgi:hypothetical protein
MTTKIDDQATSDSTEWIDANAQKPTTGKKVIVCGHWDNGNRWRTVAKWQPAGTIDASCWDDPPEDWWDEDGEVCTNPTDEWTEEAIEGERCYGLSNVTHWMHFPDMPNTEVRC